jgi:glutathione S-transferase
MRPAVETGGFEGVNMRYWRLSGKWRQKSGIFLLAFVILPFMAQSRSAWGEEAAGAERRGQQDGGPIAPYFTPPEPSRFGIAIELGDKEQAKAWLDQGLDPDYMADKIGSGLMIAAWEGNLPMLELFFERGANIHKVNPVGEQALLLAAWKGHRQIVDWLLAHGAQINRESGQWSALHYAAFSGHTALVRHLLDRGADINARSPNGSTPLMMAIYDGKPEVAKLFIDQGADARLRNDWGDGAMEWAMRFNQLQIARQIGSREEFIAAANQPKENWGKDQRSEQATTDLEKLLRARNYLASKGLPLADIDRNIAALRVRHARAGIRPEALPPRSAVLEITAKKSAPTQQNARVVSRPAANPGRYRLPPGAPKKTPARK